MWQSGSPLWSTWGSALGNTQCPETSSASKSSLQGKRRESGESHGTIEKKKNTTSVTFLCTGTESQGPAQRQRCWKSLSLPESCFQHQLLTTEEKHGHLGSCGLSTTSVWHVTLELQALTTCTPTWQTTLEINLQRLVDLHFGQPEKVPSIFTPKASGTVKRSLYSQLPKGRRSVFCFQCGPELWAMSAVPALPAVCRQGEDAFRLFGDLKVSMNSNYLLACAEDSC